MRNNSFLLLLLVFLLLPQFLAAECITRKSAEFVHSKIQSALPATSQASKKAWTIVDLAKQTRASRKGKTKTYTLADLTRAPEISTFPESETPSIEFPKDSILDETYWRKKSLQLKKEIFALEEKRITAEAKCETARSRITDGKSKPHSKIQDLTSLYEIPADCRRLQEIDKQLDDARRRREEFEETARRASVPWSWLE